MNPWKRPPHPRWFTVSATRTVCSENMQFDSRTEVQVYAISEQHALRAVRLEFKNFHLSVVA
jgi:hypothetical protein